MAVEENIVEQQQQPTTHQDNEEVRKIVCTGGIYLPISDINVYTLPPNWVDRLPFKDAQLADILGIEDGKPISSTYLRNKDITHSQ
jgi:hypothetical protein